MQFMNMNTDMTTAKRNIKEPLYKINLQNVKITSDLIVFFPYSLYY